MSAQNLSKEQQEQLLRMAAQTLGKSPDQVKQQMEAGRLEQLIKNLSPSQSQKINQLLQDPQALNQLMQSQQVQQLLQKLMGK